MYKKNRESENRMYGIYGAISTHVNAKRRKTLSAKTTENKTLLIIDLVCQRRSIRWTCRRKWSRKAR